MSLTIYYATVFSLRSCNKYSAGAGKLAVKEENSKEAPQKRLWTNFVEYDVVDMMAGFTHRSLMAEFVPGSPDRPTSVRVLIMTVYLLPKGPTKPD